MNIVILAAGLGKRMYSHLPKVLQPVGGKAMLKHVVEAARRLPDAGKIIVVVGHGSEEVKEAMADQPVTFVLQKEQKGTGHAVQQALEAINPDEPTLILYGDVPLISTETLSALEKTAGDGFALLTIDLDNPKGYGRILREDGKVIGIVEEKDASEQQRAIKEVNTGFMVLPSKEMERWLGNLKNDNKQQEYYLTDLVAMAAAEGREIKTFKAQDAWEVEGANSKVQLEGLERAFQLRQAKELLEKGVRLADKNRIDIRGSLTCGKDVFIDVGCIFEGDVVLGDNVVVGPYCVIKNTKIGDGTVIDAYSHFDQAVVGDTVKIGPFARLRPGTALSDKTIVFNNGSEFVGTVVVAGNGSCSDIDAGTHRCITDISQVINFRSFAYFAFLNFDKVSDVYFIGSDTQLVAPVKVGKGATVGAGTTVTKDVNDNTLVISRVKQTEIKGWKRPVKKK